MPAAFDSDPTPDLAPSEAPDKPSYNPDSNRDDLPPNPPQNLI
jgi:hypothetical protein